MTREENILKERFGKQNPFKVPDGYFDHLTEKIMENLPEQEVRVIDIRSRQTLWQKMPWQKMPLRKIAAAIAVAALLGGGTFWALQHEGDSKVLAHAKKHELKTVSSDDAAFNEMADYAMIDNETIYASLMAEN